jgi:hypothetical protein
MRVSSKTRWLPKAGSSTREYEDAFEPARASPSDMVARVRFAVADGASESLLAGRWAKLLVRTFCSAADDALSTTTFAQALGQWPDLLSRYLEARERRGQPIQWFEEPGLQRGAFSTFVGLQLHEHESARKWAAVAIGDSCLLHFRTGDLLETFPREPGDSFDTNPVLICSKGNVSGELAEHAIYSQGTFEVGDAFVLVTDAVAAWFLAAQADGRGAWAKQLFEAPTGSDFDGWVRELRKDGSMRNDDVTVMQISVVQ